MGVSSHKKIVLAGVTFTVNLFSLVAPSFLRISLMLDQEDIFLRVIPFCNNFVQLFSRKEDKVMSLSLMLRGVVYISDHRHTGRRQVHLRKTSDWRTRLFLLPAASREPSREPRTTKEQKRSSWKLRSADHDHGRDPQ